MFRKLYTVGNFINCQTTSGGWFIGQFIPKHTLEHDKNVEVSVKILPKHWGRHNEHARHYHLKAKEIGIVVKGKVAVEFNGSRLMLQRGDYYVLNPGCIEKYLDVKEALELVTIKVPSLSNDKITV